MFLENKYYFINVFIILSKKGTSKYSKLYAFKDKKITKQIYKSVINHQIQIIENIKSKTKYIINIASHCVLYFFKSLISSFISVKNKIKFKKGIYDNTK